MNKTILIGIDATSWKPFNLWIREGKLPCLAKMIKKGCYGITKSTIPPYSLPAIPTLFTGKSPGNFYFFSIEKKEIAATDSNDIKHKTIWDYLGKSGFKSAIINVPLTYPARKIHGIMITGHKTPRKDEKSVYPNTLINKILDFPVGEGWIEKVDWSNAEKALEKQIEVTRKRLTIAKNLIKEGNYDFSMFWVFGPDKMGHYFFHRKDILLKYYQTIDSILSNWLETFKGYNFIIISDHGMEERPNKHFNVNVWLKNEGHLKMSGGRVRKKITSVVISFVIKKMPSNLKSRIARHFLQKEDVNRKTPGALIPGIDWKSTLAYKDGLGIRINNGLNSAKYEALRSEIIRKLMILKDDDKKIIRGAWKREEICSGPFMKEMPDIMMLTEKNYVSSNTLSGGITGKQNKRKKGTCLTGVHGSAIDGIFIAHGPDIDNTRLKSIDIIDIAPTILYMYGVPVPDDFDGSVVKEIFKFKKQKDQKRRQPKKSKRLNIEQ